MAIKRRIRRKVRRKSPAVRRKTDSRTASAKTEAKETSGLMVGGAHDPAEKAADQMAGQVMSGQSVANSQSKMTQTINRQSSNAVTASGAGSAPASKSASKSVAALDAGRMMNRSERAFFEPRFQRDFSDVRIHEGGMADRANRELDARAFAKGKNIAFAHGQKSLRTFAHELAHVVQDDKCGQVHRELIRQPPGRENEPPPLTEAEQQAALTFNQGLYDETSTETILDIMGQAGRNEFELDQLPEIQGWQSDFKLPPDAKIGIRTLEPIAKELLAGGRRNPVINLIIDGHDFDLSNVASIRYDRGLAANGSTAPNWGGQSPIRIGRTGVSRGYRSLVHSIRHEIDHADMVANGRAPVRVLEFHAESVEIVSQDMLLESLAGTFSDASRAWGFWGAMSRAERQAAWPQFEAIRDQLQRRFDAAPAARQATHQAMMNNFANQAAP